MKHENHPSERQTPDHTRLQVVAVARAVIAVVIALFAVCLVLMPLATSASAPLETRHRLAKVIPPLPPKEYKREASWRKAIATTRQPGKGCFTTKYPSLKWQSTRCVPTPKYPMPPRSGVVPQIIGNGNDVAAQ